MEQTKDWWYVYVIATTELLGRNMFIVQDEAPQGEYNKHIMSYRTFRSKCFTAK